MAKSELVDVTADYIRETRPETTDEGAYLVRTDTGAEVWLPKSITERDGNTFTLPRSIAEEKGLV